jgi:hypothetical protein
VLFKNVAGQGVHVYAYDSTTGLPKTGDAANITAYISLDGVADALADTNPAEVSSANLPGVYYFTLDQAETNCNSFALYAKSATSNVRLEPLIGFTTGAAVTQTGDAYAVVNSGTYGNSALNTRLSSTGVVLTSGERTTLAAALEAAIINELDGTAVMQAIADLIASDMTTTDLTVAAIATAVRDAILNRVLSGNHDTAGSTGKVLQDITSNVTTILTDTNELQTDWTNGGRLDALIDAIKAKTDNLPADPAAQSVVEAAITAATGPLATSIDLTTIASYLDTEIADILANTNELQADWANGGRLDLLIDAIKAKTDLGLLNTTWTDTKAGYLDAAVSTAGGGSLTAEDIADAFLDRDMSLGTDSGSATVRTVRQALRFLRNRWYITGQTLTVTKEDDTAVSWESALETQDGAKPVVGSNPAG